MDKILTFKEVSILIKNKQLESAISELEKMSPRIMNSFADYLLKNNLLDTFNEQMTENLHNRYHNLCSSEAQLAYMKKNNLLMYTLSDEEKRQACM